MWQTSRLFVVVAFFGLITPSVTNAAEVWTYYFVPDGSRPYGQACGDLVPCDTSGVIGNGIRADLAGSFSVLLDWQSGIGKLIALDDRLVNVASIQQWTETEPELVPATPSYIEHGLYTPWAAPEFVEGTFSATGWGQWRLVSSGRIDLPGGHYRFGTPYDINFSMTTATLSFDFYYAADANSMHVFNAPAVLGDIRIAGDHNDDYRVDASDYVSWRKFNLGPSELDFWRTHFGTDTFATSGHTAPEPAAGLLLGVGIFAIHARRRICRTHLAERDGHLSPASLVRLSAREHTLPSRS
jgi:hypothetical protein